MDNAAPDTGTRMGVADSDGTANGTDAPEASRNLSERLAAIREDSFGIGKENIKMGSFSIKGHTVEAVLAEMRPLLVKHGVGMTPNLFERTYTGNRCDVIVDFEFQNLDATEETRVVRWAGAGTDNGDKAFAKAGTNALKEMLKKVFLITDRDDAKEETETVEHQTESGASRAEIEEAQKARSAAVRQWGTTFKAALESATTEAAVKALERENKEQLTDESLPEVTRTFFVELIQTRKTALKGNE